MAQRGRAGGRQPNRPSPRAPISPRPSHAEIVAVRTRLHEVIEPAVSEAGYDLEELSVKQIGRRHQVRVIIDGDGGVSLDDIADVSRAVSRALDDAEASGRELIAGEYQLEVSSPGVDRPLTLPRHWWRNVGRLVKVKAGERTLTGRIVSADQQRVTLEVDGATHTVAHADLGPGRVQVEFKRMNEISEDELDPFDESDEADGEDDEEAGRAGRGPGDAEEDEGE